MAILCGYVSISYFAYTFCYGSETWLTITANGDYIIWSYTDATFILDAKNIYFTKYSSVQLLVYCVIVVIIIIIK